MSYWTRVGHLPTMTLALEHESDTLHEARAQLLSWLSDDLLDYAAHCAIWAVDGPDLLPVFDKAISDVAAGALDVTVDELRYFVSTS